MNWDWVEKFGGMIVAILFTFFAVGYLLCLAFGLWIAAIAFGVGVIGLYLITKDDK